MKKFLSTIIIISLLLSKIEALTSIEERNILTQIDKENICDNVQEKDIPTILIPWILASWYSEEWYDESNVKRWIPDPITHAYDTLIYSFKQNKYNIKDVFYKDEFTLSLSSSWVKYIWSNPKGWLYVFGYDWKKDNKITATLLTQLIWLILRDYEYHNKCNIWKVNIVAHSMGWLVARSMLEDMCIWYNKLDNWNFDIPSFPRWENYIANWTLPKLKSILCSNPYSSSTISKNIKINKLVTISTPHRWSPIALPIWEKGNMEMTDGFWRWHALKFALWNTITDKTFYNQIHWYRKEVPNWIVTIGQLLPDIQTTNDYNNKNLWYLLKNYPKEATLVSDSSQKFIVSAKNYPQNSFLEELNKKENIEKMFDKIDNKYISYYSIITWNKDENNIVSFDLGNIVQEGISIGGGYKNIIVDKTYEHNWQDIYDKYQSSIWDNYYLITGKTRNQSWLWWDWTVPTHNLKLVPNNSIDWKEINNPKFKPIVLDCGQGTYKGFWINTTNEACSHTKMPFITSAKIVDFLAWTYNTNIERKYLIENFWYTNYFLKYLYKDWKIAWIQNSTKLSMYFDSYYKKVNENISDSSFSLSFPDMTDSYNMYDILSPIDIMITDDQWRRIWIDRDTGMIINEIPWAWTSGRAGESGEREFFLIPSKKWEKVEHKIETNSTWEWEYHIVMTSYDEEGNTTNSWVTIAGEAKLGFNENYEVVATSTWSKYIDLDAGLPLTLDVTKEFKTREDKIDIRYNVKWEGRENVEKIGYRLNVIQGSFPSSREWQITEWQWQIYEGVEKIDWILEIPVKEIWNYELVLELLDKDSKVLKTETVIIEKWEVKKEIKTTKNILNAIFYKDIDLSLYDTWSWELNTNYQFKVISDNNNQNIDIIKSNWEIIKFNINEDFEYKSENPPAVGIPLINGDLNEVKINDKYEIISVDNQNLVFSEKDNIQNEKIYTYSFVQDRIEKIEIKKGKNIHNLSIKYDLNWNIWEITGDKNTLKFEYDDYTWKLVNIIDLYENNIEFSYENVELATVKLNDEIVNQSVTDFIRLDYKTRFELKHKNNLVKIKTKLESQKLDDKKIQKLIKSLDKSKEKYMKLSKLDITKKEIEYLVEEIKKILEKLN